MARGKANHSANVVKDPAGQTRKTVLLHLWGLGFQDEILNKHAARHLPHEMRLAVEYRVASHFLTNT
jgi:hypothetical protein